MIGIANFRPPLQTVNSQLPTFNLQLFNSSTFNSTEHLALRLLHFERDAVIACVAMAVIALLLPWGGGWAAFSVGCGGLLSWVSYRGIRSGVDAALSGQKGRVWPLVKFFTRHAILAFIAYVMLARLRVSPVGLLAGASSIVAAACAAAARVIVTGRRPEDLR